METPVRPTMKTALDEFALMDATEQGALVRRGQASASELVDAAILRIERLDPEINALVSHNFDLARAQARRNPGTGVFAGVPTLIKDLTPYPAHATGFGSRLLAGQIAPMGSPYTEALDAAGLVVVGKSATSEFGLIGTTETLANGATRNPWDVARSPGGSSGGAVAAVASGMVPVAHASDGGGSIRGPASFCGLFGFKPSRGRTVSAGIPAEMPTAGLISDHCVSRSVRDSANWLAATERRDLASPLPDVATLMRGGKKRLRIGAYRQDCFGRQPTPAASEALDAAIGLCKLLGHTVTEIDGPPIDAQETSNAFFALTGLAIGGILDHVKYLMGEAYDEGLIEPYTREIARRARQIDQGTFRGMGEAFARAEATANSAMADHDILLCPTVPYVAFPLGQHGPEQDPDELDTFIKSVAGYTVVASLAGWPAMSVPLHWTGDGLPLGCHFAARQQQDDVLFALALELEQAAPWQHRLTTLAESLLCHSA